MSEKLLLIGSGGLGRVVLEHAVKEYDCAFLDDGNAVEADGVPVIGKTTDLSRLFGEYKRLIVTIGNNTIRRKIYEQAREIGYSFPNIVVPSAYVSPHASIGSGCVILNNAVIQNGAECGDGCILNPGVELHQDSKTGNYCLLYTNSVVRSLARVGDGVLVGSCATVATGANVPDNGIVDDCQVVKA